MVAIRRHRATLNDFLMLGAVMAVGTFLALEFDLEAIVTGRHANHTAAIELEELLALATLLLVGMLGMMARFMLTQRREVSRRMDAERIARDLAHHDPLTSLYNRRRFDNELQNAASAPPGMGSAHAVLLLDLNDFKRINDLYGHGAGDEALINVAIRLRRAARENDLVFRLGGDEFAILATHLSGVEAANNIALRIIQDMMAPIVINQVQHQVGVAVGVALLPQDGTAPAELLRKADMAMYLAKEESGSAVRFFEPEMDARLRERDRIQRDMENAIKVGDIRPFFQPLVDLRTNQVVAFEALARWNHPVLGPIAPDRFIPVAEACGLMNPLTDSLLRAAASTAAQWPSWITLSFNISASQLKDTTLGLRILSILGETGLSPRRLELELTESAIVNDPEAAKEIFGELRRAGVRIALDDFGTGYSSLYHLRTFEVDKLKIDRSFISAMQTERETANLVKALLGFGHGLGLIVTAEGVEEAEQAQLLLDHGCDQGQGYLYARPMPAREAIDMVAGMLPPQNAAAG